MSQPFFVVGMGRSGSSYLRHLLNRHPQVALTNESHILDVLSGLVDVYMVPVGDRDDRLEIMGVINPDYGPVILNLFRKHVGKFLDAFYKECFPDKDFTHWGDKLPSVTAVGQFLDFYPHTRFVMLVRDPRDVVCSFMGFEKQRYGDETSRSELFTAEYQARRWTEVYSGLLERIGSHHLVKYEAFVDDPETTIRGIFDYLELPHTAAVFEDIEMADFHAGQRTASKSKSTVGRWRTELSAEDLDVVQTHCGELMQTFGYLA